MDIDLYPNIQGVNEICGGKLLQQSSNEVIENLLIDSRAIMSPVNTLFLAIVGERNDGHNFISDLYNRGFRNFVISKDINLKKYPEANFIKVNNSIKALQDLGKWKRNKFNGLMIAITGSNGKTMVKEWIFQLIHKSYRTVRSPKSYNSKVGVPLSLWEINPDHEIAIIEAGISKKGEMAILEDMIKPDYGVFTNIGPAHAEGFESLEDKAIEKAQLFRGCSKIIYCSDSKPITKALSENPAEKVTWNDGALESTQRRIETLSHPFYEFSFEGSQVIKLPFNDHASVENAIHSYLVARELSISQDELEKELIQLSPIAMRLEILSGINQCTLINDAYNSDLFSIGIALDLLNSRQTHKKNTLILSDILQSGMQPNELYRKVAEVVKTKKVDRFIGIGEEISKYIHYFHEIIPEVTSYLSTEEFLQYCSSIEFKNEGILIKGSRIFEFERISDFLQEQGHETVLEVNLSNMIHNLNYYRSLLKKGTKMMVMVKASSYGTGSKEIAKTLQFHNIDYLSVAYADEGIELRKAGIQTSIMVMNPEKSSFGAMIRYQLEPEIYNLNTLKGFAKELEQHSLIQPFNIHIKLDTGMKRLGFEEKDIPLLLDFLKSNEQIKVASVFSHLVGSDDDRHDVFTQKQINQFKYLSTKLSESLGYQILKHILNSSGIVRFPDASFDMVRLGIGIFGFSPIPEHQEKLENVCTLKTTISQIKIIDKDETIGYNRSGHLNEGGKIATIPIGYADGLRRDLSNGKGSVIIGEEEAKIVGNICMDMCMIDVSNISAKEGDEVIIFNSPGKISKLAKQLGTIPYEILSSISNRVKRVYLFD